jgi:DNA-binding MarR family transcriptional regulator
MPGQEHRAAAGPEQQQMLRDFIRQVSPEADPTSIALFGLLMEIRTRLMQAAERNLDAAGLSWAKLRLLMHLGKQEHVTGSGLLPSELSRMQNISRNTVSALINGLEAEGLVTREPHSSDRRKLVIRLTPQGRAVLKSELGKHLRFVSQCFGVLDRPQRDMLFDLLASLNACLKEDLQ